METVFVRLYLYLISYKEDLENERQTHTSTDNKIKKNAFVMQNFKKPNLWKLKII